MEEQNVIFIFLFCLSFSLVCIYLYEPKWALDRELMLSVAITMACILTIVYILFLKSMNKQTRDFINKFGPHVISVKD